MSRMPTSERQSQMKHETSPEHRDEVHSGPRRASLEKHDFDLLRKPLVSRRSKLRSKTLDITALNLKYSTDSCVLTFTSCAGADLLTKHGQTSSRQSHRARKANGCYMQQDQCVCYVHHHDGPNCVGNCRNTSKIEGMRARRNSEQDHGGEENQQPSSAVSRFYNACLWNTLEVTKIVLKCSTVGRTTLLTRG